MERGLKSRCGYLDGNGKQCKRSSAGLRSMHLDGELFSPLHDPDVPDTDIRTLATWVVVDLCKEHAEAFMYTNPVKRGTVRAKDIKAI